MNGINHVKITLNSMDTYDLVFSGIRGTNCKVIKEISGIYGDQLREVFSNTTGLVLSL